jgi:sulfate adenylyltransferase
MTMSRTGLIPPVGGSLVDLIVPAEGRAELRARANRLPSIQLSERALYDLELLATGGFSPLDRFMGRGDFERVVGEMRLAGGQLFPIPVVLPVDRTPAVRLDQEVALRDAHNELLGIMTIDEAYEWDRAETAQQVLGTRDVRHPLVAEMQR